MGDFNASTMAELSSSSTLFHLLWTFTGALGCGASHGVVPAMPSIACAVPARQGHLALLLGALHSRKAPPRPTPPRSVTLEGTGRTAGWGRWLPFELEKSDVSSPCGGVTGSHSREGRGPASFGSPHAQALRLDPLSCRLLSLSSGLSLSYMSLYKISPATSITVGGNVNKLLSIIVGYLVFHKSLSYSQGECTSP